MNNNYLNGTICYTAGPMDFEQDGYGLKWRSEVVKQLTPMGVRILSPYDDTLLNFPTETGTFKRNVKRLKEERRFDELHDLSKLIVRRDLAMVDKSDFLIVNINTKIHMCGTYHEFSMAKFERKPVFVFCENICELPIWIYGCIKPNFLFEHIEDIFSYLNKLNSGEEPLDNKYWKILKQSNFNWIESGK